MTDRKKGRNDDGELFKKLYGLKQRLSRLFISGIIEQEQYSGSFIGINRKPG